MFGMGFMEILLIAVIAIIALGPDKLPSAMVEVAKFIKKFKSGLDDAKTTLNEELNVTELKEEANKFKAQFEETKTSLTSETKIDLELDEIMKDEKIISSKQETKTEKKPDKKEKVSFKSDDIKKSNSDKFKVKFNDKKEENA